MYVCCLSSREPEALNILVQLFIERNHLLWKVPEVSVEAHTYVRMYVLDRYNTEAQLTIVVKISQ